MGRSVSYASGSIAKAYYYVDWVEDDQDTNDMLWEDFLYDVREQAQALFPSLTPCDEWLGNEDRAILENTFCYVGVSEYCGVVCLWLVPKEFETYYPDEQQKENLSKRWLENAKQKFDANLGDYNKVATFSNGEAMFEKKKG